MNIGIIVFPGSNCDRDVRWATEGCLGVPTSFLWHETTDLDGFDAIVIPGVLVMEIIYVVEPLQGLPLF